MTALIVALLAAVASLAAPAAAVADGAVSPETWMRDLSGHIATRKLTDIVMPGSHDTATYSLDGADWTYAGTQNTSETLTAALNQGIRQSDVRVKYKNWGGRAGADYWGYHGASISTNLRLGQMLDQIERWTLTPSHEHEIILLGLSINTDPDGENGSFPTATCKQFTDALGNALLTPNRLKAAYGIGDPGQVTPGQLFAMSGHPRVIMDNEACMGPSAGRWTASLFHGYYANQCFADPYTTFGIPVPGVSGQVIAAARTRGGALEDGFADTFPGRATGISAPLVGGLYVSNIQSTTTAGCFLPLKDFSLPTTRQTLSALVNAWDTEPAVRAHLNVISGDFLEETDLVRDVLRMNAAWPLRGDAVLRGGPELVRAEQGARLSFDFPAAVLFRGESVPEQDVTYRISPPDGARGPNINGQSTLTATANDGIVRLDGLNAGPRTGTWTVTASVPNAATVATWTLQVAPVGSYRLVRPPEQGSNSFNVQTLRIVDTNFQGYGVQAVSAAGEPLSGIPVTFYAPPADYGGFGRNPGPFTDKVTVTTDDRGYARSGPFTSGTRAAYTPITATSPSAPAFTLGLTTTPGYATRFVVDAGDQQSTPVKTVFPATLRGHFTDPYGNTVTTGPFLSGTATVRNPDAATWYSGPRTAGVDSTLYRADRSGRITLPELRAGQVPGLEPRIELGYWPAGFRLTITPGAPHALAVHRGDNQSTAMGEPFAAPFAVKVTDVDGYPVPDVPVTFSAVAAGHPTFPRINVTRLDEVTGEPAPAAAEAPRTNVTVQTDANGVATSPALTAGDVPGRVTVIAYPEHSSTSLAVHFTDLSVTGRRDSVARAAFLGTDRLHPGQVMRADQYILSKNSKFALLMQSDGNLVLYGDGFRALWAAGTAGHPGASLAVQQDGNIVIYSAADAPLWATRTDAEALGSLIVQDDGNLVAYSNTDTPFWATHTVIPEADSGTPRGAALIPGASMHAGQYLQSADGRYVLVMQADGNLVLYGPGYHPLWATNTSGHPDAYLRVQDDGDIVLDGSSGSRLWATNTSGVQLDRLEMQSDGNLVAYNTEGRPIFATDTDGRF